MPNVTPLMIGVTRELVWATATELYKLLGTKPSRRAVKDRIGRGSMSTISKHMQAWESDLPIPAKEVDSLGDECIAAIQNEIEHRLILASESLTSELQKLREDYEALEQENLQLNMER
jgi:colicin import membrane protein